MIGLLVRALIYVFKINLYLLNFFKLNVFDYKFLFKERPLRQDIRNAMCDMT